MSIWVTPGTDLTNGMGLLCAGLAFAPQQVIVSFAAYVMILRGDTLAVGDRITLGGVRGDVVRHRRRGARPRRLLGITDN